jgi:hypothetical protein
MGPTYSVTTGLLLAFAAFVIYIRSKNWLDSNIPLFFYVAVIAYMNAIGGSVPVWLLFTSFAFTLLLRFEFMNESLVSIVRVLEMCTLSIIIYLGLKMVF